MSDLQKVIEEMRERLNNILRYTNDARVAKEASHALDRLILIEAEQKRIKNYPRLFYAKAMQYARDMGLPTEFPLPEADQQRMVVPMSDEHRGTGG